MISLDIELKRIKKCCKRNQFEEDEVMVEPEFIEGDYDPEKSDLLLEALAIEIQMCQ